jgi:hypothetical protein
VPEAHGSIGSNPIARTNKASVDQSAGVTTLRPSAVWVRIPPLVPIRMVNSGGPERRLESGWHREVSASTAAPSSRSMGSQSRRLAARP